ncbi:MAG: fumarate hydratase [bacterium]
MSQVIKLSLITETVRDLCLKTNYELGEDIITALQRAREAEDLPRAREVLDCLIQNAVVAKEESLPICQDTGIVVVFIEIGQEIILAGGNLEEAINEGVRRGYKDGFLRASVVNDPLRRINTGDNTPAVIHSKIVTGNRLNITLMAKGSGSENMSALKMFKPADGWPGARRFIIEHIKEAAPYCCPPLIVGVGLGGTFEQVALLAKRSLLREVGRAAEDEIIAARERELLEAINDLNIGPGGLGGKTTALSVNIETAPCHIAGMPVAVNVGCYAHRHRSAVL